MSRLTTLRLTVAATLVTVFTGGAIIASQKSAATMARAAAGFLDSLTPEQKAKAAFPFESDDRLRWHFIPNEMFPRQGLMIKDMNETQRVLAFDLLRTGLSSRGLREGPGDHGARRRAQGRRKPAASSRATRTSISSRPSARRVRRASGAGASKGITFRSDSRSPTAR